LTCPDDDNEWFWVGHLAQHVTVGNGSFMGCISCSCSRLLWCRCSWWMVKKLKNQLGQQLYFLWAGIDMSNKHDTDYQTIAFKPSKMTCYTN
jgi:hypothetical protein